MVFRSTRSVLQAARSLFAPAPPSHLPRVVASLPPIHSLLTRLFDGVALPELLQTRRVAMRLEELSADQVDALENAELVVWSGTSLEGAITEAVQVIHDLPARQLMLASRFPVRTETPPDAADSSCSRCFWLNPRLASLAVRAMAPALVRLYPIAGERILDNETALMHELHQREYELRCRRPRDPVQVGGRRGGFDPLGFDLTPGAGLYGRLMERVMDADRPQGRA